MIFIDVQIELQIPKVMGEVITLLYSIGTEGITMEAVRSQLISKLIEMLLLCAFTLFVGYIAARCSSIASMGFGANLRRELFFKIQSLSFENIDKLKISSLITRMTSDVNQVQTGINLTLRLFLRSPFVVFGAAIMAYIIDPSISVIFFITILILSIVVFGIMLLTMPLHKRVQESLDNVLEETRENLTGVRVVRAFTSEEEEIEKYQTSTKTLEKSQNKVGNISNLMNPLTYIIINLAIILLIYKGALKVDSGILLQGQVIALYNYMSQILIELIKLANLIITMTKSVACMKRIAKIIEIDTSVNIIDKVEYQNMPYIRFDNVSMKYHSAKEASLENISFDINKGETIGIIGGTGSGKTSLINLLFRFYDVGSGEIYIDGIPLNAYHPKDLRNRFSIVMQKAVLFKGTIKENLLWGNSNATDEDLKEALKIAQGLDIIEKKELGLDAIVEQNGRNFSGGQRQRLSLARAIIKKSELLVLDDSASALDYATDAALRKAINNLDYKPTVIIVSQRTASVWNADKIIVLDDGKLVGLGTHDELLENNVVYQEIYYSQFKKEDNYE